MYISGTSRLCHELNAEILLFVKFAYHSTGLRLSNDRANDRALLAIQNLQLIFQFTARDGQINL